MLAASSIGVAVWGQWTLSTNRLPLDGAIAFVVAGALFAWFVLDADGYTPLRSTAHSALDAGAATSLHLSAFCFALAFAVLTWLLAGGNRLRLETVLCWVAACGIYVWSLRDGPFFELHDLWARTVRLFERGLSVAWPAVAVLVAVLVGAFFRYYQLGSIPPEMTSDHAEKLLDVRDLLGGETRVFFPRNTGREPLQFYMAVPFTYLFGLSHLALKALTATMSLLTVPLVYLIGRELGGSAFGALSAFVMAVSSWDVTIGRVGLRFPYYPFFVALTAYLLLRALRTGRRNDYLLCGLALGAGLYGYSPFRSMVLAVALALGVNAGVEWTRGWAQALSAIRNGAACLGAATMVFVPLLRYMADEPRSFWWRTSTRLFGEQAEPPGLPLSTLASNTVNALLMFNWRGDMVWVNAVPLEPALDYVSGGLLVLGVLWCAIELVRHRSLSAGLLLLLLPALMLPSVFSLAFPRENPSVVRTGGALPLVACLVAAPLYLAVRRIWLVWPGRAGRLLAVLVLFGALSLMARASFDRYFVDYARQYAGMARNSSEVASVMDGFARSVGSNRNAFIKSWPHWIDTRNVAFILRDPAWNNVLMTDQDAASHPAPGGNKLYVLHKSDQEGLRRLRERFPEGQARIQPSATPGKEFQVFFVPGK